MASLTSLGFFEAHPSTLSAAFRFLEAAGSGVTTVGLTPLLSFCIDQHQYGTLLIL